MKKIWLHISVWTRSFLITFQLMVISFFDIKATFKILGWSIKWENIPMNFWTLLNYTQLASCILSGYLMHVWFCHSIHWSLENLALLIYVDFPSGNMFHYTLSKIIDIIVNADLIRRVYRYWETIKLLSSGTNYHTMFHFFFCSKTWILWLATTITHCFPWNGAHFYYFQGNISLPKSENWVFTERD
jgi:hypothetical protein